jgi:hypothetical protein
MVPVQEHHTLVGDDDHVLLLPLPCDAAVDDEGVGARVGRLLPLTRDATEEGLREPTPRTGKMEGGIVRCLLRWGRGRTPRRDGRGADDDAQRRGLVGGGVCRGASHR